MSKVAGGRMPNAFEMSKKRRERPSEVERLIPADDVDHVSQGSGSHPQPSKQNHVAMAKKYRLWKTTADE